jgi:hypothetical protein
LRNFAVLAHEPPPRFAEMRARMTPRLVYGIRNPAFDKAWRPRVLEPTKALSHLPR